MGKFSDYQTQIPATSVRDEPKHIVHGDAPSNKYDKNYILVNSYFYWRLLKRACAGEEADLLKLLAHSELEKLKASWRY